jgi:DNA-binding CsgD family transcriptional regulator
MTAPANDVGPGFRLGLTGLLIAIATWGVVDLLLDRPEHWLSAHVLVEIGFVLISLGSVFYLWLGWVGTRRSLGRARGRLAAKEVERDRWKARATKLLQGLGAEIDAQFERWVLTPAERQVAMLLLKGLGHKEVAALLERSERTVRQHAVSVYRKSELAGRAELSAFFLEDLLLPADPDVGHEPEDESAVCVGMSRSLLIFSERQLPVRS